MGDYEYDDGLVHRHLWASEAFGRPQVRQENTQRTESPPIWTMGTMTGWFITMAGLGAPERS